MSQFFVSVLMNQLSHYTCLWLKATHKYSCAVFVNNCYFILRQLERCLPFAFLWSTIISDSFHHLFPSFTLSMLSVKLWNFGDIIKVNSFCVAAQWTHQRIQSCSGVAVSSDFLWWGEKMAVQTILGRVMEFCSTILSPRLCLSLVVCGQIVPEEQSFK
jgi:hypothetical protein